MMRSFLHGGRLLLALLALLIVAALPASSMVEQLAGYASKKTIEAPPARSSAAPVRYRLDAAQSKFMVKAFAGGLLSAFAHDHNIAIKGISGEALITTDSVTPASLHMTIRADSLAITDKVSDKDRNEIETTMRTSVLEVQQYPEIVFKSTNISADKTGEGQYNAQIWGDVTLHGVTKSIWFKATVTVSDATLRARGSFALRQSDFKIKPPSAGGGTVKVKDELKFSFDIVGVK